MQRKAPNERPPLDAAMSISFHFGRHRCRASEAGRWCAHTP